MIKYNILYGIVDKYEDVPVDHNVFGGLALFSQLKHAEQWLIRGGGYKNPDNYNIVKYKMTLKEETK